jgi:hypothetical protein
MLRGDGRDVDGHEEADGGEGWAHGRPGCSPGAGRACQSTT